ncbi:C40 family peptidase [bacterium]|nr:C40 family peptidase [bacterium]
MIAAWAKDYIGIPYADRGRTRAGVDCYGLLYLVLSEQFGAPVPSYAESYATAEDFAEVKALIAGETRSRWRRIPEAAASSGDAIVLSMNGLPFHVGVVADPETRAFLNVFRGTGVALERWTSARFRKRIEGFYRYAG